MSKRVPQAVLSEALGDQIAGRTVRAAVFTTYSFDPGFFEEHCLPVLFQQTFSHVRKVRMLQLEDALRDKTIAVYYDRSALEQEALPACLDVRRVDVHHRTGAFHPKVILVLVDNDVGLEEGEACRQSLIVGILSANLTRSGWWESVEAFHFEEITDRDEAYRAIPFRDDLLSLLRALRDLADPGSPPEALELVHQFLRARTVTESFVNTSARGRFYTRIYTGRERLSEWLTQFRMAPGAWNLEVVSPFHDAGDAPALKALLDELGPASCRVFLPETPDGAAAVDPATYAAVAKVAKWARLPGDVTARSPGSRQSGLIARGVHAKVYRFFIADGSEVVLVGSPNLTSAGHRGLKSGNFEAAFWVDQGEDSARRTWWLEPLEKPPVEFKPSEPEEEPAAEGARPLPLSLRFDWESRQAAYNLAAQVAVPIEVLTASKVPLFTIATPTDGTWVDLGADVARALEQLLISTSLVYVRAGERSWIALVREERMAFRPSLLVTLTPEEILHYWSLLSPAQREAFMEQKLAAKEAIEALPLGGARELQPQGRSLFDRFAGVFHAFQCLEEHVAGALEEGHVGEAEMRLFGEKYDSLPVLLDRVLERQAEDPVLAYVTWLSAVQVSRRLRTGHPEFFRGRAVAVARLDRRLERLDSLRDAVRVGAEPAERDFLAWFEEMFLRPVAEKSA